MSKQGKGRRTPEQRIARKQQRSAAGAGVYEYLSPKQLAAKEHEAALRSRRPNHKKVADAVSETK